MAHTACGTTPEQRRPQPQVSVLVDFDTFEDAAQTTTCELGSGQVITPGQLAPLLGGAVIERIVFDGPARRLVEIGEQRTFTGAARRAIQILQRHCQHPGCHIPALRCELDHVVPHSRGGPTSLDNAQLLCPAHNRWKADRHPGQLPKPRGEPHPETKSLNPLDKRRPHRPPDESPADWVRLSKIAGSVRLGQLGRVQCPPSRCVDLGVVAELPGPRAQGQPTFKP